MNKFDWVVIGGGSGGYAAARSGVELGLKTAVIDDSDPLGGLCILRGCMPSKTLIESANRFRVLHDATAFGLRANGLEVKAEEIVARKRQLVGEFASYRQSQLNDGRFDLIRGRARYLSPYEIEVTGADGTRKVIHAQTSLVATGSNVKRLHFSGIDGTKYLISDDVLEQTVLPASIIILGGGAIALELAHYYGALGTHVTIIQRSRQLLTSADPDIATVLKDSFEARGIEVYCGTKLLHAEKGALGKTVRFEHEGKEKMVHAEEILMATGRDPNTNDLGLEEIGVALTSRGGIVTDNQQRTTLHHVFAAGDVCSPLEVVHLAVLQGEIATRNAAIELGKEAPGPRTIDYRLKLFGIFTEPEIAMVGVSEQEARDEGVAYRAASYPFNDHGKSMVLGSTEGFVKLLTAEHSGCIIGASVIGPQAVELIHEVVVAMHFNATAADLASVPHYHPTLSEIWTYPAEELA